MHSQGKDLEAGEDPAIFNTSTLLTGVRNFPRLPCPLDYQGVVVLWKTSSSLGSRKVILVMAAVGRMDYSDRGNSGHGDAG